MSSSAEPLLAETGTSPPGPVAIALWFSGFRCIVTYVLVPALAPTLGAAMVLAVPVLLALYGLSIGTSAFAAWRSAGNRRWPACGTAASLVVLNLASFLAVVGPRIGVA